MMCNALSLENIQMWDGLNSWSYVDNLPKQIVMYMLNMKQAPTSLDVVAETLRITQRCRK